MRQGLQTGKFKFGKMEFGASAIVEKIYNAATRLGNTKGNLMEFFVSGATTNDVDKLNRYDSLEGVTINRVESEVYDGKFDVW